MGPYAPAMTAPPGTPISPPRLYAIVAREAPVALVFRRGPSEWFHLLRWHLETGQLEHGAWARKRIYPKRCDLSDDGELMLYYIAGAYDGSYNVFAGLSRAPWLHPLESWEEGDTWGPGWCFDRPGIMHTRGTARVFADHRHRVTIRQNDFSGCVNQLRRGWSEAPHWPPLDKKETWDERRAIVLLKHGEGGAVLRLEGFSWWRGGPADGHTLRYALDLPCGERLDMPGVVWADWDHRRRVLVATADGFLRALDPASGLGTVEEHDLNGLTPDPQPAPDWASALPPTKRR